MERLFSRNSAYSSLSDELGRQTPIIRVVLTNWPVTTCNPFDIGADATAHSGRYYAYFQYELQRRSPQAWALMESEQTPFLTWEWSQKSTLGWIPMLTSGRYEGGEQVVGKILVSSLSSEAPTGEQGDVRVNHCGFFSTLGNLFY